MPLKINLATNKSLMDNNLTKVIDDNRTILKKLLFLFNNKYTFKKFEKQPGDIGTLDSTIVPWIANKSACSIRLLWHASPKYRPRDYQPWKDENLCLCILGLVHNNGTWVSWFSALKISYVHLPCTVDIDEASILIPGNLSTKENKSSSTASAGQVQANLQEQLTDHLHFRLDRERRRWHTAKCKSDSVFEFFTIACRWPWVLDLWNGPREFDSKHLSISLRRQRQCNEVEDLD